MSDYVIPAPQVHAIPTEDGGAFPVRSVYCIGRNFAAHAVEMGHDPDREPRSFFKRTPTTWMPLANFPTRRRHRMCITKSNCLSA